MQAFRELQQMCRNTPRTSVPHFGVKQRASSVESLSDSVSSPDIGSDSSREPFSKPCPERERLTCRLCKSGHNGHNDFLVHLTVIHFRKEINALIKPPYICQICGFGSPNIYNETSQIEEMFMHLGVDEKMSHKFYLKFLSKESHPSSSTQVQQVVPKIKLPKPVSAFPIRIENEAKNETITSANQQTDFQASIPKKNCTLDQSQKSRTRQTIHNVTDRDWKSDFSQAQALKQKMESMEQNHQRVMKEKSRQFERWITSKEKALEDERKKLKEAESKLEEATVDKIDAENQVEAKDCTIKRAKEYIQTLEKDKELSQKEVAKCNAQLQRANQKIADLGVEIDEKSKQVATLNEKLRKETVQKQRQLKLVQAEIVDQNNQIKTLTAEVNDKTRRVEAFKENEIELKQKFSEKVGQLNQVNFELASLKATLLVKVEGEKLEKQLHETQAKLSQSKAINEDLERQNAALLQTLDQLQTTMNETEEVSKQRKVEIETLTKSVQKYEEEFVDLKSRNESLQSMIDSKNLGFTKELERLRFENSELEIKLQEMGQKSSADAENVIKLKTKEKEFEDLKEKMENLENDLSKAQARLRLRHDELSAAASTTAENEFRIRDLEREIREKSEAHENEKANLTKNIACKEAELKHLRFTLKDQIPRMNQMKKELNRKNGELNQIDVEKKKLTDQLAEEVKKNDSLNKKLATLKSDKQTTPSLPEVQRVEPKDLPSQGVDPSPVRIVLKLSGVPPVKKTEISHPVRKMGPASKRPKLDSPPPVAEPVVQEPKGQESTPVFDPFQFDTDSNDSVNNLSNEVSKVTTQSRSKKRGSSKKGSGKKAKISDEADDDENTVCQICFQYDPPTLENCNGDTYVTNWISCDCKKWFHQVCTKVEITENFSCRDVNMECDVPKKTAKKVVKRKSGDQKT